MIKIVIPVLAVVLVAAAFVTLWLTGVLPFGKGGSDPSVPDTVRETTTEEAVTEEATTEEIITVDPRQSPLPPTPTQEAPSDNQNETYTPKYPSGGELPGAGGEMGVSNPSEYTFTPNRTGLWVLHTANNGDSTPNLAIYTSDGNYISHDDSMGGMMTNNAKLVVYLSEGTQYIVVAAFTGSDTGRCSIVVKPPQEIPSSGGNLNATAPQGYLFTPNQSGVWTFRTSNNGRYDPLLTIYDSSGIIIGTDDDSGGDSNAMISIELVAGELYDVYAGFHWLAPAQYTISVTFGA